MNISYQLLITTAMQGARAAGRGTGVAALVRQLPPPCLPTDLRTRRH
jgi:hypothetical protein